MRQETVRFLDKSASVDERWGPHYVIPDGNSFGGI